MKFSHTFQMQKCCRWGGHEDESLRIRDDAGTDDSRNEAPKTAMCLREEIRRWYKTKLGRKFVHFCNSKLVNRKHVH